MQTFHCRRDHQCLSDGCEPDLSSHATSLTSQNEPMVKARSWKFRPEKSGMSRSAYFPGCSMICTAGAFRPRDSMNESEPDQGPPSD